MDNSISFGPDDLGLQPSDEHTAALPGADINAVMAQLDDMRTRFQQLEQLVGEQGPAQLRSDNTGEESAPRQTLKGVSTAATSTAATRDFSDVVPGMAPNASQVAAAAYQTTKPAASPLSIWPTYSNGAPLPMDVLAVIAQAGGVERAQEHQASVAVDQLRESTKGSIEARKLDKKNKKRGGVPEFVRMTTQFAPGKPLVFAVTSPKGGVGKSTTAANLAAYLAMSAHISGVGDRVRVLLVDGDVANGNLALRVSKRLQPNMLDLLNHLDSMRDVGAQLTDYQQDMSPFTLNIPRIPNLDVLAAPDNPDIIDQIEPEDLEDLMRTFARFYQIVVYDTGTQITEHTNCAWMAFSSQVYMMIEPEVACLQGASEYARRARKMNILSYEQCRVIMIRADSPIEGLEPKRIVSEVFSFVPPDRAFFIPDYYSEAVETGNAGEFLVMQSAEFSKVLKPIVQNMLQSYESNVSTMTPYV